MKELYSTIAVCPFFNKETTRVVWCEIAAFHFPDNKCKSKVKEYCCSMTKHKECTLYKILMQYYEEKENHE